MRLLDRYIAWEYIKIFCIITFSFTMLFLTIDFFDRLPRLLRFDASKLDAILYLLLRAPYIIVLTSPISVLLSGLFLMSSLSKYNESIAIRAAGISIRRMVLPVIIIAFFYSLFILAFGEYVLPKAEQIRSVLYNSKIKKRDKEDIKMRSSINYLGKDNHLYYIGFFDGYRNILRTIDITHYSPETGKMIKKITAISADWDENKWIFKGCSIKEFQDGVLVYSEYFPQKTFPEIDVSPVDFIKSSKDPISMNYFELSDYIDRLKKIGENFNKELVELKLKISFPFSNFIIIFFSIPLASSSVRSKGRGLVFVLGIVVCFLYISSLRICQSLGYNGIISPELVVWLPNIVFGVIGISFLLKAEV